MQPSKSQAISQKIAQLQNQLDQELARESEAERKLRSRQAIILGSWLMANKPERALEIANQALRRPQDRAAFGLAPWEGKSSTPPSVGPVDIPLPPEAAPPSET